MSDRRAGKLNQLQSLLPEGLLASAAWLEKKGYSQPLRSQYVSSAGSIHQPEVSTAVPVANCNGSMLLFLCNICSRYPSP